MAWTMVEIVDDEIVFVGVVVGDAALNMTAPVVVVVVVDDVDDDVAVIVRQRNHLIHTRYQHN
jgi:hypothetical protein